jgi:hypothetical protein
VDAGGGGSKILAGCRGLLATCLGLGFTASRDDDAGSCGWLGFAGVAPWVGRGLARCVPDESRGLFPLVWFPWYEGWFVLLLVCWCLWWCSFLSCVIRLRITPHLLCVLLPWVLSSSHLCYSLADNAHLLSLVGVWLVLWCVLGCAVARMSQGVISPCAVPGDVGWLVWCCSLVWFSLSLSCVVRFMRSLPRCCSGLLFYVVLVCFPFVCSLLCVSVALFLFTFLVGVR